MELLKVIHNLNSAQMVHGITLPKSLIVLICRLGVKLDSYPDVSDGFEYLLDMETASPYYKYPVGCRKCNFDDDLLLLLLQWRPGSMTNWSDR
jgi:hypothetical protein